MGSDGLDDLGIPPSSGGQPFISMDLAATGTINKSGYDITYAPVGTAITSITTCSTVTPGLAPGATSWVLTAAVGSGG